MTTFTIHQLLEYGGIVWAVIASSLLARQQLLLLEQRSQLDQFAVDVLEKYNELENTIDSRMDASEEGYLLQLESFKAKLNVHDSEISSAQNWIGKLYDHLLLNETADRFQKKEDTILGEK